MTGTTPQQFANLVDRAIREGLRCRRDRKNPHLMLVSSRTHKGTWYRVTRTSCGCLGHKHNGVCCHRALACHMADSGQAPFRGVARPLQVKAVVIGTTIPGTATASDQTNMAHRNVA